jgi:ClpP class serine protease
MTAGDLFWFALLGAAFYPLIKQKALELARRRMLSQLEQKRGSRAILLVHRQETMAFFGLPIFRYIDVNDSEEVIRAIHLTDPKVPIDLLLPPRRPALASIARPEQRPGKVTVLCSLLRPDAWPGR